MTNNWKNIGLKRFNSKRFLKSDQIKEYICDISITIKTILDRQ